MKKASKKNAGLVVISIINSIMNKALLLLLCIAIGLNSKSQSPHTRYTYTIDSIHYINSQNLKHWSNVDCSPLQMVTVDYGNNLIKLHLGPLKAEETYKLKKTKEDKSVEGQTTYDFTSTNANGQPCILSLLLLNGNWDHPALMVRDEKEIFLYYLKEF